MRKLYPDAELPTFEVKRPSADELQMLYKSKRPFADLALGLIRGCADHYGERVEIERVDLATNGTCEVRFILRRS